MTIRERNRLRLPNQRRALDVKAVRETLSRRLEPDGITQADAAEWSCVPRDQWKKFETGEKKLPDGALKLVVIEAALEFLENTEADHGLDAVRTILGGSLTVEALRDYLHAAWQEFDPKARSSTSEPTTEKTA